ncbi:helix-hairpin-helix domain-containing protein [Streptomyces sparsogenes]|uniref:helix-hairpin-helix domain-containing protein n=1 Tax=Streptomyces sparsogenes TaxID=67365 RepID=UPI0033303B06
MSTDRLAGDAASAPEEEPTTGAPAAGTDADTDTDADTGPAGPTAAPPSGAEAAADATQRLGGATEPQGDATRPPGGATEPLGGATQPPGGATEPPADGTEPPGDATGAPRGAAGGAGGPGGGKRSAAAEALAAAVRAVESGERSAASFFTDTPAARQGRAAARGAGGAGPEGARERTGGPGREQPRASAPGGLAPASGALAAPGAGSGAAAGQPVRAVPRTASGPVGDAPGAAEVRRVLAEGGAPESLAGAVVAALGEGAAEALREDPWQLLAVPGVRPDQADGFARALLGPTCGPDDERRAQALTVWLLERAALEGHTALESSALRAGLAKLSVPDPDAGLRSAIADGRVLVFQDALDTPGTARPATGDGDEEDEQPVRVLLGLDRFALAEESLADGLARLASTFSDRLSATPPGGAGDEDSDAVGEPGATGTAASQAEAGASGADEPEAAEAGTDTNSAAGAGAAGATRQAAAPEAGGAAAGSHAAGADSAGADTDSAAGAGAAGTARRAAAAEAGGAAAGSHTAGADSAGAGRDGDGAAGSSDAAGWEAAAVAAPSPSAAELIRAVAGHGLVAHTGGEAARAEPAALVAAAGSLGLRAYAAAHTEDGRRRLAELIDDAAAVTVAGLLAGHEGPGRDEDGALALDLIAVLDAPQLDVETAAMLVESLPDGARLVLSGDPGVLWSAGPGKVFADLLAARRCPQVVSRTPDPGPIGELVSGIGIGELNQVEAPGKEVVIVPVRDAGEAVHRTVQLVADSVPRALGVPSEHTQVITPGHGGAAGTRALNAALKERLNPGPGRFGGFDPGDRVAYVPAPGRALPGTVVSADAEGLHLDCAGTAVVVPRERVADTVRPGWALTAHQAVGMRWPAAVVVLPQDAAAGLTRAWVYTAFSRGERHLSVVHGADAALARAVAEIPATERTTRLRSLLQTQLPSMAR